MSSAVKWINCDTVTEWQYNKAKRMNRLELNTRLVTLERYWAKDFRHKKCILYDLIQERPFCDSIYIKFKDSLNQRVLIWYDIDSQGAFGNVWRYLWLSQLEEARDAVKHPAVHKTVSQNKELSKISIVPKLALG